MTALESALLALIADLFAAVMDTVGTDNAIMRPLWRRWQVLRAVAEQKG